MEDKLKLMLLLLEADHPEEVALEVTEEEDPQEELKEVEEIYNYQIMIELLKEEIL